MNLSNVQWLYNAWPFVMSNTSQFFLKMIQHYYIKSIGFDNELTKNYKVKNFFWGWKIDALSKNLSWADLLICYDVSLASFQSWNSL